MTVAPGTYDFTIYQGASFSRLITWKDAAGVPVNITGYTARLQIRQELNSPDPFLELTTENGGIALGGAAGTITLAATATATAALTPDLGVYDLELISGSVITRLLQGQVTIAKEVTR